MVRRPDKPLRTAGFFWQGVLILLPVLVLAVVGFVSIQQDKAVAQREAVEHAQTMADQIADSVWNALVEGAALTNEARLEVDWYGRLKSPAPAPSMPEPEPLPVKDLTLEQLRLWIAAQCDKVGKAGLNAGTNCTAAWREFIEAKPPPRFVATAQFQLALLLMQSGDSKSAREIFGVISRDFPDVTGEAGLPLAPLAALKAIELTPPSIPRGNDLYVLCERITTKPDPMTQFLLNRAVELDAGSRGTGQTETFRKRWEHQEFMRVLYAAAWPAATTPSHATNRPAFPRLFWFEFGQIEKPAGGSLQECHWLATLVSTNAAGAQYIFRPALDERAPLVLDAQGTLVDLRGGLPFRDSTSNFLGGATGFDSPGTDPFLAALAREQMRLPPYFGLSLSVGGRSLFSSNQLDQLNYQRDGKKPRFPVPLPAVGSRPTPTPLLAFAQKTEEGSELLRVGIHLVAPDLLYEHQQARSFRFGLLIVASALAAFIGFFAARRAFLRTHQLSEMKSNFVSSVSHELRAPIASVRLMAENLERGKVPDAGKQHDYFRFIVQECRRLSSLIENVLDFARIEQRRKQYDFEPTDIEALVAQTVKLMEPAAAEKNVTLQVDAGSGPHAVPGPGAPLLDGSAIQQALVNLLDNAIKHSPKNSAVTVQVSVNPSRSTLQLAVIDRGPGIPESEHKKIFERFYRRGSELRRETPGVGIGLSIVKHIAEAHGGRILLESAPGKGSRFTIELPLDQRPGSKFQSP